MEFKLPYHISNNGDGSASVVFHATREEADTADEAEEGWGEQCSDEVTIRVDDGKVYVKQHAYVKGSFQTVWTEVPQEPR